ncbi:hypothetical protein [Alicyclobacillus sendaiensis]|uniref:hypothetical protein n=1 Tax=Alicyclobacillus sendaiensis TaxID=192387 RepID=UPI000784B862|nr:hypothetical protein [Alicyclobacillus sendaiensis]
MPLHDALQAGCREIEKAWHLGHEVLSLLASNWLHEAVAIMQHRAEVLAVCLDGHRGVSEAWMFRLMAQTEAIRIAAEEKHRSLTEERDRVLAAWPVIRAYEASQARAATSSNGKADSRVAFRMSHRQK